MAANQAKISQALGKPGTKVKLIDLDKRLNEQERSKEHRVYAASFNELRHIIYENQEY